MTISVGSIKRLASPERERFERRARLLAWGGNAWHLIEFAIAIGAGTAAESVALIGFGADSLIEGLAGFVVVWLFTGSRLHSETAERRAQQLIACCSAGTTRTRFSVKPPASRLLLWFPLGSL